jgi:uncharacterized protein YjbJ (UPF0337 family)
MNEDILKGKWNDIKGEIKTNWGKLTDDDLDQTKGNVTSIAGIIQEKYGHAKEEVSQKLNDLFSRFSGSANDSAKDASSTLSRTTESAKENLRDTDRH